SQPSIHALLRAIRLPSGSFGHEPSQQPSIRFQAFFPAAVRQRAQQAVFASCGCALPSVSLTTAFRPRRLPWTAEEIIHP
uniref:hypothetical protein n=1 Tax=Akkermansia sp. TaxID=1872421 RepID=UPI003AB001C2